MNHNMTILPKNRSAQGADDFFFFFYSLITQSYRDVKTLPEVHLCEKDLTKLRPNWA